MSAAEQEMTACVSLLLYLLLAGTLLLCIPDTPSSAVLESICAAGTFLLLSSSVLTLVKEFCTRVTEWKNWLISFAPVYAAVLAAGGKPTLAAVYNGFFLSSLQLLSYAVEQLLVPCLNCYLALSAAGIFSGLSELSAVCRIAGEGVKKAVRMASLIFTGIMGLQKTFGSAADSAALRAGQTLSSAVPVIGQVLSAASSTVLAAASVLHTGLGFAAIAVIAAEFLPFTLRLILQLLFLYLCALLCKVFGLSLCGDLLRCACIAVEVVCAIAAMFFLMIVVASALMMQLGGN